MSVIRSNFGDLLAPGMRQIFFDTFGEKPAQYTNIFNMQSSNRQYEDDSYVTGFGLLAEKSEGAGVTYDDPIQGFDKRYTHTTRELAYRVSAEMGEDDLYSTIKKLPQALGRSTRATVETSGANVLNRAFTAGYTGGDGSILCVTSHVLVGGGTQSNAASSAADLTSTSLENALLAVRATTDDRGILYNLMPKKLIVPPEVEWTARKLLNSAQVPENANNAINPAASEGLQLVVMDYLTDADSWFIQCDNHEMNWFWRVTPDHMQGNDFDTDDAKFKVRARWSNGWSLPWGIYGTAGA